jgi:hypothetical protein
MGLSYINRHTIQGMVSKRYNIFGNGFSKNKNKIVLFYPVPEDLNNFPQKNIYISYLLEQEYENLLAEGLKLTRSKDKMLLSKIDQELLSVPGQKFRELRETRNKFDKIIKIKTEPNSIDDIMNLIDIWDDKRGSKYGWQRHSGYDRNFFEKFWQTEKESLFSFFFYLEDKLVGYSIISKLTSDDLQRCYNYVIRKNDTSYRNLCLYIDFKSFQIMHQELQEDFIINWGATSKYKKKFPIYKEVPTYFCKVIK